MIVVGATLFVDRLKIDDPVGAVAVHGFNGVFGTIAVGLFDVTDCLLATGSFSLLIVQTVGVLAVSIWGFAGGYAIALIAEATVGLRASAKEEEEGLDMAYHGIPAYNELERFTDVPASLYDFQATTGVNVVQPGNNQLTN